MRKITLESVDKLNELNKTLLVVSYAVDTDIDRDHIASVLSDLHCQIEQEIKKIAA